MGIHEYLKLLIILLDTHSNLAKGMTQKILTGDKRATTWALFWEQTVVFQVHLVFA